MKTYLNTVIALLTILFTSCYSELDLESYRSTPKVVLNSVASPDTTINASISKTSFFPKTLPFNKITNANIEIYINGDFVENMSWQDEEEIYTSTVRPKTGETVKIIAETELGEVWAEDIIPQKTEIIEIKISQREAPNHGSTATDTDGNITPLKFVEIMYQITFQDMKNIPNYYCIRIDDDAPYLSVGVIDYSSDPIFKEQASIIDGLLGQSEIYGEGGRTFTDKTFDGEKYTLTITESAAEDFYSYSSGKILTRRIILYSISESYYYYLTSLLNFEESIDQRLIEYGFSEPKRVHSNVINGTGIFGTCQSDIVTLNLLDFLKL